MYEEPTEHLSYKSKQKVSILSASPGKKELKPPTQ